MNNEIIKKKIEEVDIEFLKKHLGRLINKNDNKAKFIGEIIIYTLEKYNKIKNTKDFDDCELLLCIITIFVKNVNKDELKNILQNINLLNSTNNTKLSLLDYVYRKQLFFVECDLITLFLKNNLKIKIYNDFILSNIFCHYSNYFKKKSIDEKNYHKLIVYQIIKSCNIIEVSFDSQSVINNLIYMYQKIDKNDYEKYKSIYMSFEEYDNFYKINKKQENIKFFMINILFFSMLERNNFKSLYKLMKTIIYNRELLSYLRIILKEDPDIITKYKKINEIAKESLFINSEHQMLLNNMIDVLFDFDNSTINLIKNKSFSKIINLKL